MYSVTTSSSCWPQFFLPSPFLPAGATVVCGVCFVLWIFSGLGVLFPALFGGSSGSGPSRGWRDGPQPGSGGGLQGVSWWQLYTRHPAQVRITDTGWYHLIIFPLYFTLSFSKWNHLHFLKDEKPKGHMYHSSFLCSGSFSCIILQTVSDWYPNRSNGESFLCTLMWTCPLFALPFCNQTEVNIDNSYWAWLCWIITEVSSLVSIFLKLKNVKINE